VGLLKREVGGALKKRRHYIEPEHRKTNRASTTPFAIYCNNKWRGAECAPAATARVSMVTLATRKISRISSINVQTPPIAMVAKGVGKPN
jgi:hypothetical protein